MNKGFTLIELLIVVAIIGILAAVGAAVIPGLLEKAKIPIPKWKEVKKNTIMNEAHKIGFPIIVKSSNNSGSRGSTKLFNEKGLNAAYNLAKKNSTTGKVLIEEFLDGKEQSVEIFFDENQKCTFLNVVDRFFSDGKWSIELGHVNPTKIRQKTELELFNLTKKSSWNEYCNS